MSSGRYSLLPAHEISGRGSGSASQLITLTRILRFLSATFILGLIVGGSFIAGRFSASNREGHACRRFIHNQQ